MAKTLGFNLYKWSVYCKPNFIFVLPKRSFCAEHAQKTNEQSDSKEEKKTETHPKEEDTVKQRILNSSLNFVQIHGWSKKALIAGAESAGCPGVAHGLFPKGGVELVEHFYLKSNNTLAESMNLKTSHMSEEEKRSQMRSLLSEAVEERLRMIIPYINQWPEALSLMSMPPNIPTALANILTLVDDICFYAGDRSIDITWYGRRIALAGIYKATELYMLSDKTEDYKETWVFLNRRMEEAEQLQKYLTQAEQSSQFAKDFASATFITARNILRLNFSR